MSKDLALPDSRNSASLAIVLPGLLDKSDYAGSRALSLMLKNDLNMHVVELDMYNLPGVKKSPLQEDVYHCEWTPSQYLLAIKNTIETVRKTHSITSVNLVGFSYGAQIAMLFGIADAGLKWQLADRIIAIMPSIYYHWEGYEPNRDWLWSLRQYHKNGFIDLDTVHPDIRIKTAADPTSETRQVNITRRSIFSHMRPFDGILKHSPVLVSVPDLGSSGLLKHVQAKTLVVSGGKNELVPDAVDSVASVYKGLSRKTESDLITLKDVKHDYRSEKGQISMVNGAIRDWFQAA